MLRPSTWLAADTETHILIDGQLATAEELDAVAEWQLSEARRRCSVDVYKWMLSDGYETAVFGNFDDFLQEIARVGASAVWWYNAKFDFANVDYYILSHGWTRSANGKERKDKTFDTLQSGMGARYQYTLTYNHAPKGNDRHKDRTHRVRFYDLCNIFGGGLEKLLKSLNVCGFDGVPIRKQKTENYQAETADDYDDADTRGLFHAVRICDEYTNTSFGLRLAGKKPDCMTAGGIAKRIMLSTMYHTGDKLKDRRAFHSSHPMNLCRDKFFRDLSLYKGGLNILNPRYQGRLYEMPMYRYDRNSMYPAEMEHMPELVGNPFRVAVQDIDKYDGEKFVRILVLTSYEAKLKTGKVAVWHDPITGDMTDEPLYHGDGEAFFEDEWNLLTEWYTIIHADIAYYIVYNARKWDAMTRFVHFAYEIKREGRASKNPVMAMFGKLLCNSAYGKLAQNPVHVATEYVLDSELDAVRLETIGEETDENGIMDVVQGALVTSRARCALMREADRVCQGLPALYLVYSDTDSLHTLLEHPSPDTSNALGGWKCEGCFTRWKYIAPKTYMDYAPERNEIEFHTKGLPPKRLLAQIATLDDDGEVITINKSVAEINDLFAIGQRVKCLQGINIPGGKGLIPIYKYIADPSTPVLGIDKQGGEIEIFEL